MDNKGDYLIYLVSDIFTRILLLVEEKITT